MPENVVPRLAEHEGRARVAIENLEPRVDAGRFPAKRVVGDIVIVEADVFADGHEAIAARLDFCFSGDKEWQSVPMQPVVNDRWTASFRVDRLGTYQYKGAGWVDQYATWRRDLLKRVDAGQDVATELLVGADLVRPAVENARGSDRERLQDFEQQLRSEHAPTRPPAIVGNDELTSLMARWYPPVNKAESKELVIWVDRPRASFS